ncbi:MAG: FAD-dependent oxidoreductase [Mycobacteriales bacterium]|nr:FAD-dependent oxidoreductase [Mycobacteriales bacterium]
MAITMYGTGWCSDCKRAKQFFGEQRVHYDFVDVDADTDEGRAGRAVVQSHNDGKDIIPTIVFDDGSILVEPSNAELAEKLGLQTQAKMAFYDLIVVGSGPAGLTAALYAAREGLTVLVVERAGVGGQAGVTERLDNFPGFPEGVGGGDLADRLRRQAKRFGVEVLPAQEVTGVTVDGAYRGVTTGDGKEYAAFAVLLTLGSTYRRLGIEGEDDLIGAGVHFCATCDGPFYRGKDVVVIGGGNSAGEESAFLTRFAESVTVVTRDPELSASRVVVQKLEENAKVTVVTGATPTGFATTDAGKLRALVVDTAEGSCEIPAEGAFVFIGLTPNSDLVRDLVDVDEQGFVLADPGMQTSVPGVFVAGDVRSGSTKQAASAAGEGAAAALAIRRYVEPLASGIRPRPAVVATATV